MALPYTPWGAGRRLADSSKSIISREELENFVHEVRVSSCGLCSNHCRLTVNLFGGNRRFIGGNRCEKPVTQDVRHGDGWTCMPLSSRTLLVISLCRARAAKIGIPMGLNMYELLPFWHTFFTDWGLRW